MKRAILFIEADDAESSRTVQTTALAETRELLRGAHEEAPRLLAHHRNDIAVVIIDFAPGQVALDLLEAIAASATNPPVIVLSDEEQLGSAPFARKSGAAACIRKPLTVEKLTSVLAQLCSAERHNQSWTSDAWGHPHRRLICTTGCELETSTR